MVKKKVKPPKKSRKGELWVKEDVIVHTSLPPQVEGQLRCYLKLCVNQILWSIPNAPEVTHVRVQWWGETSEGATFKPKDVKRTGDELVKTTARYPIRSGPKQFAAYLSDLATLVFEVLSGPMQVPVGRAIVDKIGQLNPSRPINGFFPVLASENQKVADLQVSIALESLMASYDSTMSSVPTPDMSVDFYQNQNHVDIHFQGVHFQPAPVVAPVPPPSQPPVYSPHNDPFNSPLPQKTASRMGQTVTHLSRADAQVFGAPNPLRESLHSQTSGGQNSANSRPLSSGHETTLPPYPSSTASYPQSSYVPSSVKPYITPVRSQGVPLAISKLRQQKEPHSDSQGTLKGLSTLETQIGSAKSSKEIAASARTSDSHVPSSDLVSVLLERGHKLKEAMIKSTLDIPPDKPDLAADYGSIFSPLKKDGSTQNLYNELLKETSSATKPGHNGVLNVQESYTSDLEERAVDIVMGADLASQQYKLMKAMNGSPASSLSLDEQHSDLGDPLHDDSILNELFYRDGSEASDIELEMYTGLSEHGTLTSQHTLTDKRQSRSRHRDKSSKSKRNTSAVSMDSDGNMRPPSRGSRCSSMSSIILNLDEPSLDLEEKPKKKKKKMRSRSASLERKKKGGKKTGRRSRSRSRGGGSHSDSELIASETSRVSFDTTVTEQGDQSRTAKQKKKEDTIDGLSVQRLTLLGRVHVARVVVDKLCLEEEVKSRDSTPVRGKSRGGKPPRPAVKKGDKSTYFVEYNFPVVASSRDKYEPNAIATEIIRVASKNVNNSIVTFGHRSVFPVIFDADSIDKWWKSALVFKLYCRNAQQKVPILLGTCSMPLKSVLKSESLYLDKSMEVKDRSRTGSRDRSLNSSKLDDMCPIVGNLRIHVELASDSKDFSTALAKTRLAEMTHPLQIVPIVSKARPAKTPLMTSTLDGKRNKDLASTIETQTEPRRADIEELAHLPPPSPRGTRRHSHSGKHTVVDQHVADYQQHAYELRLNRMQVPLTLHTLIMIPEGQNITEEGQLSSTKHGDKNPSRLPKPSSTWSGRDMRTRNLYLNCRMFWCDDAARSNVCWGSFEPKFDFTQVAPVLVSASLLERLRNNLMVVEVWDKKTTADTDQLVGIVKLPLHQFYMSFRDRKIANSLLKSQYPVVAVDGDLPILSPFSGQAYGQLRVLLAMGSQEQITSLQNTKCGHQAGMMVPERPTHFLERQDLLAQEGNLRHYQGVEEHIVEHQFDMSVESVKGLRLLDNMIWGEADCFVQYHFPAQTQLKQQDAPDIVHAAASLKAFRTTTTLCVPDPVFNDVTRHRLTLHEGSPVQRELLNACAGAGGGAGGIPFEIWCRYYYPNVREQVIAKAQLPLARLCAMVTMQKAGQPSVQSFTLQLQSLANTSQADDQPKVADSELLELTVTYSNKTLAAQTASHVPGLARTVTASTCLAVGVVRASGLQAAAGALARHDEAVQYAAEVGVNTYVRVKLSFLPKEDERITRTVARTFAPDFNFYMDFPTPLLWTEAGSDALSLAEILETAEATFELWHQAPSMPTANDKQYTQTGSDDVTARKLTTATGDVMLGCVNLPLIDLLKKKTGINGWFPVYIPTLGWDTSPAPDIDSPRTAAGLHRVVGGLELSIKFAHADDLTRVIGAAKGAGWEPDFDIDSINWEDADELSDNHYEVTVALDNACFPVSNALIAGQTQLDLNARAYLRYKFYDTGAKCSRLCGLADLGDDFVRADVSYTKTIHIPGSSPFSWYLKEEKLEVQLWVTYHSDQGSKQRPRNRDKLIGSAYIDLSGLARRGQRKAHRISDIYPLYKPGTSSLGGACLRAHVSIKPTSGGDASQSDDSDVDMVSRSIHSPQKGSPTRVSRSERERSFGVHISIERAFHLPIITDDGESQAPNAYVSYQTADKRDLTYSAIFPHSSNPVWNHEHDTRLSREMLAQHAKGLVFKVWHKPTAQGSKPNKGTDKVLGFVSVDLVPLTTGFNMLCGWYNVMDFHGVCQGQIKVSITPLETLVSSTPPLPPTQAIEGSSERFTQFLRNTTQLTTHLASQRPVEPATQPANQVLPHFSEHYESVKRHHEQLNNHMSETGVTDPSAASRSLLFNSLRNQMDDLDKITSTLKQRLNVTHQYEGQSTTPRQNHDVDAAQFSASQPIQSYTQEPLQNYGAYDQEDPLAGQYTGESDLAPQYPGQPDLDHEQFMNAEYRRPENDSSTYSQTLRNAQGILHTADQLIANINTAATQIGSKDKGRDNSAYSHQQPQTDTSSHIHVETHIGSHSHIQDGGGRGPHHTRPRTQAHVRFDERSPQMSDELPNYSHYQGLSSNTNTDTPNASSEPAMDLDAHLEQDGGSAEDGEASPGWQSLGDGNQGWGQYDDENDTENDEDDDEDAQVVVAKPLNDVSSANFANYASLHEEQLRHQQHPAAQQLSQAMRQAGHNHSVLEEQDSWFSGHGNASVSKVDELYDTINSEDNGGVDRISQDLPTPQNGGALNVENGGRYSRSQNHVHSHEIGEYEGELHSDRDNSTLKGTQETSEELLEHLSKENPTAHAPVSRTSHSASSVSHRHSARKAGENRREYLHHRHGDGAYSSDSDFGAERPRYSQRSSGKGEGDKSSSSESEGLRQTNPMLMTQKTINLHWNKDSRSLLDVAEGFDLDEESENGSGRGTQRSQSDQAQSQDSARESNYSADLHHSASLPSDHADDRSEPDQEEFDRLVQTNASIESGNERGLNPNMNQNGLEDVENGSVKSASVHDISGSQSDRSSGRNRNGNNNGDVMQSDLSRDMLESSVANTPRSECGEGAGVTTVAPAVVRNRTTQARGASGVPSFFPHTQDLASTMKALRIATNATKVNTALETEKADAKRKVLESLSATAKLQPSAVSARTRPRPDSTQADRIAKIFQQKFT